MKKIEVEEFLKEHKISYEQTTPTEFIVNPCPLCGTKNRKFYINRNTGLYDCKKCGKRGNFFKFKAAYGVIENIGSLQTFEDTAKPLDWVVVENLEKQLEENEVAQEYLRGRGFTDETIIHFKLGYKKDAQGEWIAIPHIENNELWNVKYRRFAGGDKTFKRVTGQPTVLYNSDEVDFSKDTVYVTEAETDCIAAWQMGVENVVALTGGAQTFKPVWKEFFARFSKVYLILDSDEDGQIGARKIAEKIGLAKVRNVILPTKDPNEYMQKYSAEEFRKELSKAIKFEMKDVSTLADVVNKWDDWFSGKDTGIQGLQTGHRLLDKTTGGFKEGDLVILSGNSGIGKTTFTNTMINKVLRDGHPVLGFYLEGQINYMIARMVGGYYDMPFDDIPKDPERYAKIKEETMQLPLHWYSGAQGGLDIAFLKEYIPAVIDLYGIKLIVIDNLQKVVRGSDSMYTQRVSETVSTLKDIAVDTKVPILLISHPKKLEAGRQIVTMMDAKSSSTIFQDADQYWILQRVREERWLTIEKNRMGEDGVNIPMDVNMENATFRERDMNRQEQPTQESTTTEENF